VGYEAKHGRTGNHLIGAPKSPRSAGQLAAYIHLVKTQPRCAAGPFLLAERDVGARINVICHSAGMAQPAPLQWGDASKAERPIDNRSTLCLRTRSRSLVQMSTAEDYKQLSNRFAELAISSSAPSVAQALLALALDYVTRATKLNQPIDGEQPAAERAANPIDGFGD
jgi:hypothetical protein